MPEVSSLDSYNSLALSYLWFFWLLFNLVFIYKFMEPQTLFNISYFKLVYLICTQVYNFNTEKNGDIFKLLVENMKKTKKEMPPIR